MSSCLLHICCAPCSIHCIQTLRNEGIEPTGYWYNPNIHPYTEYRSRKTTLQAYAESIGMKLIVNDDYGLRDFVRAIYPDLEHRCETCYRLRMEETARRAAEEGFSAFCTTLLVSPYQNHDLLVRTAEEAAVRHGVRFLYRDFRPGFCDGQQAARDLGLYMQKYCGCVFSEEERYRKKKKS